MELANAYRARRKTQAEEHDEREANQHKRQRALAQVVDDLSVAPSSTLRYAAGQSFGYRDYVVGKAVPTLTRSKLDGFAAERMRGEEPRPLEAPPGQRVPSLVSICINIFAEHHDERAVVDCLDRSHSLLVRPLVNAVLARTGQREIPFNLWMSLAYNLDLPDSRKTYRGLSLEDKSEIACLDSLNKDAVNEWQMSKLRREPSAPPTFFLAAVDLRDHGGFGDGEMWRLTDGLAPFLAVLRLDSTRVSDNGLASIVRNLGDDEHYERLEVLSLRGLRGVSDKAAISIAKLPALRLLDIRGTSCTDHFRQIVNKTCRTSSSTVQPWRMASKRPSLPEAMQDIEFRLFGGSYSLSNVLTQCRRLAPDASTMPKSVLVHIDTITRGAAPAVAFSGGNGKTTEQLYLDQIALRSSKNQQNSTFSRVHGNVTSTVRLSKGTLALDAAAEDKGAAFRMQDDGVAAGAFVGAKTNSLYNLGMRKHQPAQDVELEEPFSDRGSEGEEEDAVRWEAKKKAWDEAVPMYRGPPPPDRRPRTVLLAGQSPFTLVRHLPVPSPFERPVLPFVEDEDSKPMIDRNELAEGATLAPKKRRKLNPPAPPRDDVPASPVLNSKPPRPANPFAKPKPSNPFAKKRPPPPDSRAATPAAPLPRPRPVIPPPRRSMGLAPLKSSSKASSLKK
ncbi:hypothetical protein RQP46_006948 [Phenoliferia psychrophenolica]